MVNVTNRADVAVRLIAFKLLFGHLKLQPYPGLSSKLGLGRTISDEIVQTLSERFSKEKRQAYFLITSSATCCGTGS